MRRIECDGYPAVTAEISDPGPAPMLQWVPIEQLVVDDEYQRPIAAQGRRNVQRIAHHFEWAKFAPVVVAPVEGGLFAVIDGQHRTTAAHLRGVKAVIHHRPLWTSPPERLLGAFREIDLGDVWDKARADALRRPGVSAGTLVQADLTDRLTASLGRSE